MSDMAEMRVMLLSLDLSWMMLSCHRKIILQEGAKFFHKKTGGLAVACLKSTLVR